MYDLRESNVNVFVSHLSRVNFTPMYSELHDLDDKCLFLNDAILSALVHFIPSSTVIMTTKDKPYITPVIKALIYDR